VIVIIKVTTLLAKCPFSEMASAKHPFGKMALVKCSFDEISVW